MIDHDDHLSSWSWFIFIISTVSIDLVIKYRSTPMLTILLHFSSVSLILTWSTRLGISISHRVVSTGYSTWNWQVCKLQQLKPGWIRYMAFLWFSSNERDSIKDHQRLINHAWHPIIEGQVEYKRRKFDLGQYKRRERARACHSSGIRVAWLSALVVLHPCYEGSGLISAWQALLFLLHCSLPSVYWIISLPTVAFILQL